MTMNYRTRKPDPLLLLALVVGLGVVLTTAAQAEPVESAEADRFHEARARLALSPVRGLAERLEMHWLNNALERPAAGRLLAHKPLEVGRPFGADGPALTLSWRPRIAGTARAAGDSGIGAVSAKRPDVYISLRRSW
jgi:hypothetical protein